MLKVSLRGLFAHKSRLILTLVAVIVSVGFMSGTQVLTATVSTTFDKIFSDVYANIDTVVRSTNKVDSGFGSIRSPVSEDLIAPIMAIDGVSAAEGQVQAQLTILDKAGDPLGNATSGPPTFGLNWHTQAALNGWKLMTGNPPTAPTDVVIDQKSAEKAGYRVGDTVRIQLTKGVQDFTLVGIGGFGTTKDYAGSSAALFEEKTAQALLVEPGKFTWISVAGAPGTDQEKLRSKVATVLPAGTEAITGQAFTAESQDVFRKVFDSLGTILFAFGLVGLSVGAFIIYNTFSIIVAQRTRELALLRAMGASKNQVLGSVTFEALVVGALASALGLVFGIALATGLTKLLGASGGGIEIDGLTYKPMAFISSFGVGVLITVLSALFPAWRAARVPPVAAMRDVAVDTSNRSRVRLWLGTLITLLGAVALYWGLFGRGENQTLKAGIGIGFVFLGTIVLGPLFARPLSAAIGWPLRWFNGRLARANAMRNPRRTAATASALMIGVGLIVMFAILIQSIKTSVSNGIDTAFSADLIVDSRSGGQIGLDRSVRQLINDTPGVAQTVGLEVGFAETSSGATQVFGADLAALPSAIKITTVSGDLANMQADEVAISKSQSERHNWPIGQQLPMTFLQGGPQILRVGAIYEIKDIERGFGYFVTEDGFAAHFPAYLQTYAQVYAKVAPGTSAGDVQTALKPKIKQQFPTAAVENIAEYRDAQAGQFNVILSIITVLLVLAVAIAILGIINTLLLSVYERTHEIGLLRAVGMARRQVRSVVRWESLIFSLQGTTIGTGIGFLFAWALVRALQQESSFVSLAIPWALLSVMVLSAAVAGVIAAIIPAFSASRLKILDAIATE